MNPNPNPLTLTLTLTLTRRSTDLQHHVQHGLLDRRHGCRRSYLLDRRRSTAPRSRSPLLDRPLYTHGRQAPPRTNHVLLLTLTLALTLTLTLSRPAPPRTATAEEGGPSDLCLRIASSATAGQAGGGGVRGRPARRAVCRLAVAPSLRAFSACVQ